jgi:hypothetical protein
MTATTTLTAPPQTPHAVTTAGALRALLVGGKTHFAVASATTGARCSFKVTAWKEQTEKGGWKAKHGVGPWAVAVRGPEGWVKGGTLFRRHDSGDLQYKPSGDVAPAAIAALTFVVALVNRDMAPPAKLLVWRGTKCLRCGLPLVSDHVHLGMGADCCDAVGLPWKAVFKEARAVSGDSREAIEAARALVYDEAIHRAFKEYVGEVAGGLAGEYVKRGVAMQRG